MKYITHHRFKELALCNERLNLPYGTEIDEKDGTLYYNEKPICISSSENAKLHFSRNDDNKGLERGRITYSLAYASRRKGKGERFSEIERSIIVKRFSKFLRKDSDYILFNDSFFNADIEELYEFETALKEVNRR